MYVCMHAHGVFRFDVKTDVLENCGMGRTVKGVDCGVCEWAEYYT